MRFVVLIGALGFGFKSDHLGQEEQGFVDMLALFHSERRLISDSSSILRSCVFPSNRAFRAYKTTSLGTIYASVITSAACMIRNLLATSQIDEIL